MNSGYLLLAPIPTRIFTARTTVTTLLAPHRTVFNFLANIENLPRWAGGFCESLWLGQGRWMGLTSLGELFLELEADSRAGEITLLAGWAPGSLYRLPLQLTKSPDGGARVKFSVNASTDERQMRLFLAVENEIRDWAARFGVEFLPVKP